MAVGFHFFRVAVGFQLIRGALSTNPQFEKIAINDGMLEDVIKHIRCVSCKKDVVIVEEFLHLIK